MCRVVVDKRGVVRRAETNRRLCKGIEFVLAVISGQERPQGPSHALSPAISHNP